MNEWVKERRLDWTCRPHKSSNSTRLRIKSATHTTCRLNRHWTCTSSWPPKTFTGQSTTSLQTTTSSSASSVSRRSTAPAAQYQLQNALSMPIYAFHGAILGALLPYWLCCHQYGKIFRDVNKAIEHKAKASVRYTVCHKIFFSETKLLSFWTFKNISSFYFIFLYCIWYFN